MDRINIVPGHTLSLQEILEQLPLLSGTQSANVLDHMTRQLLNEINADRESIDNPTNVMTPNKKDNDENNLGQSSATLSKELTKVLTIAERLPHYNANTLLMIHHAFDALKQKEQTDVIDFLQQLHHSHFGKHLH